VTGIDLAFTKAHGAGNDFLVVDDHDGAAAGYLDAAEVARLCRRHLGIGADGLLRVVRAAAAPADALAAAATAVGDTTAVPGTTAGTAVTGGTLVTGDAAVTGGAAGDGGSAITEGTVVRAPTEPGPAQLPEWFMDYRNADGGPAAMCGNGVRVFAAHLLAHGLVAPGDPVAVLTRSGIRTVHAARPGLPAGWTTVAMGPVTLSSDPGEPGDLGHPGEPGDQGGGPAAGVHVDLGGRHLSVRAADVGNPHAVAVLAAAELAALAPVGCLPTPTADPAEAFPDGFNLELVAVTTPASVRVRIVERGVGETLACGTGVCAAVAVAAAAGLLDPAAVRSGITVDVPGGTLDVRLAGRAPTYTGADLSGPALVVATGTVRVGG